MEKNTKNDVSPKFISALTSMYSVVKSYVRYGSERSEFITSNIGVKQGEPASSILCIFVLNDILDNINIDLDGILSISDVKLVLLLSQIMPIFPQDLKTLHSLLNDIDKYCISCGLKLKTNNKK